MSDKKLLEEGTVRRFQALANIKPLNTLEEGKKKGSKHEKGESAKKEKAEHGKGHESEKTEKKLEETHHIPDSVPAERAGRSVFGEEEEMGDMGADMGGGEEAGGEGGDDVKPAVEALVSALNDLLSKVGKGELEVDVEAGAEGGEEAPEAGEGEEEEEEEGVMEAKQEEEGYGMKKEAKKPMKGKKKEEEEEGVYESLNLEVEDDEALAEELTRRVAARLVAEMKKAKKSMTEDFTGGGTKHSKPPKAKGNPGKSGSFGTKSKGR